MQAALAPRGDARTFLTHFVGAGLEDDRCVVETFRSLANGEPVPVQTGGTKPKGRRKAPGTILPLKAVENMRPARDEIIIATGGRLRHRPRGSENPPPQRKRAGLCPRCGERRPNDGLVLCGPPPVRQLRRNALLCRPRPVRRSEGPGRVP